MQHAIRITAAVAALGFGTVYAQTISQTFDIGLAPGDFAAGGQIELFDTLGGTRQLTGVQLAVTGTLQAEVVVQNFGPTIAADGTWEVLPDFVTAFSVFDESGEGEGEDEGGGGGEPDSFFQTFGGFSGDPITGDIPAGDGGGPFGGNPGIFTVTTSGALDAALNLSDFAFFERDVPTTLDWISTPFFFPEVFSDPGVSIAAGTGDLLQQASITVTYSFIPAPASVGLLAVAGLAATRRRR